jgi:hypothetical protein
VKGLDRTTTQQPATSTSHSSPFLPNCSLTGVLFNSAHVTTEVRNNLVSSQHGTISFWAGLFIIISALFTILSLISTFTAWAMVSSIDDANAHCVLRSSIGQYAAELPGRFIVLSIYSFLISFMLFFFLLLPVGFWSILLLLCTSGLFFHVVSVFSGFGRIIMHSGAMSKQRIFSPEYEEFLVPESLHANLLKKAKCNLTHNTSIIRQYRRKQQPINQSLEEEQLWDHLNGKTDHNQSLCSGIEDRDATVINRSRADSIVRFADEEEGLAKNNDKTSSAKNRTTRTSSIAGGGSSSRNLKQSSYSGQHSRSATPLSVLSKETHCLSVSEISFDQDTPRSNDTQKHFPPRPPPFPPRDERLVQNVSTASVEQWLQGTPPEKSPLSKDTPTQARLQNHDGMTNNFFALDSPSQEGVTNLMDNVDDDDSTNRPNESVGSRSQLSTFPGGRIDRRLSEEERFAMDYGEYQSDEDDLNRMNHGEYNYLSPRDPADNVETTENGDDERSNLLGNEQKRSIFYSGAPPFTQTGPRISRGKTKEAQ